MSRMRLTFVAALAVCAVPNARATDIAICTDLGRVTVELFHEQAPQHVANFLRYLDDGFYVGTVFHRVIDGFMVQGGGHDRDLNRRPVGDPVPNESSNGLSNERGTLAAARTDEPDSATAQFFINLVDNPGLDGSASSAGYTVFGRITDGMEILDEIGSLPTGAGGTFPTDVPDPLVAITALARIPAERPFAELDDDERLEAIRNRITATIDAEDLVAASRWFNAYHAECGEMTADLRITEATVALVTERKPAAVTALDEYFRLASPRHGSWEVAQSLYEMVSPENPGTRIAAPSAELAQLAADCLIDEPPALPDGATATLEEMLEAQARVRTFLSQSEDSIDCLDERSKDDDISDDQRSLLVRAHNDTVDVMEEIAGTFNKQIAIFRERQ